MELLVFGPQGAGKGTQAKRIAAEYDLPHVSTGDIFREAVAEGSDLGRQVEPILARGDLVPDELTIALIRDRLGRDDAVEGFVLDGFPRNLAQAEALDELLAELGRPLDAVLLLELADDVCVARMTKRAEEEGRRDDTPEVIRRRLEIYHEQTEPLVEYYRARDVLVPIPGSGTVDEVFAQIRRALDRVEAGA